MHTSKDYFKATIVAIALTIGLVSCSGYNDDRGKGDAPVKSKDDSPAVVINFPDGFLNVAFKCLNGNGIYTHTREAAPVVVVDDPNCDEGAE